MKRLWKKPQRLTNIECLKEPWRKPSGFFYAQSLMKAESWPLAPYLPPSTNDYCIELWVKYSFELKVVAPRKTKLGDYRFKTGQNHHLITINKDLNPYSFLVVYLHEVAHCINTMKNGTGVKPHGRQWQEEMILLLLPLINEQVFPQDIKEALESYLKAPKATSCSHPELTRVLRKYDNPSSMVALESLANGAAFRFRSKDYRKLESKRTRVKCMEIKNQRHWLINKLALVHPL